MNTTKRYSRTFSPINGTSLFPVDMLRYDECFPASQRDARIIETALEVGIGKNEKLEITVSKFTDNWTLDRWESFGWRCVLAVRTTDAQ